MKIWVITDERDGYVYAVAHEYEAAAEAAMQRKGFDKNHAVASLKDLI